MRFAKLLTLFAVLVAEMAVGQYTTTYKQGLYDMTASVKAGMNVWKYLPGGGVCQPNSGSMSFGGFKYYCVGTDNYPYDYDRRTHGWTKRTDLNATGMAALAVRNAKAIYALWASTSCPSPDKTLWFWNGSAWALPNGTLKCLSHVSVGSDGFLAGITQESGQQNILWDSKDGGKTWNQWESGYTYVHMWNQNAGCAVSTSGAVYTVGLNGPPNNVGGNFVGCMYGDRPFVLMAWGASGNVSMIDEQNGAWDPVSGLNASHIAGVNKLMVMALDQSNHPYHWNIQAKSWSGQTTGTWHSGCPSPSLPCFSTTQHQSNLSVYFNSGHGIGSKSNIQKVTWNQPMNNYVWDASPGCDPMFGTPADPECTMYFEGHETCMQSDQGIGTADPPSEPELSHDYQTAVSYFNRIGPQLDFVAPNGLEYWGGSEELNMADSCLPGTFATCPGPDPHDVVEISTGTYGNFNVQNQLDEAVTLANPYISEDYYEVVNGISVCDGDEITWGSYGNFDDPNFVPKCD